jgi:acetyl-CoA carboxylase biotin carboxyl carrier protein
MPADDVNSERPDNSEVLESVCRGALELIAAMPGPPLRRIVLHSGQTSLEIEWPRPGQAPGRASSPEAPPSAPPADEPDEPDDQQVKAPAVGTFFRRPDPAAEPFVEVGDQVEAGRQVAIVEAMKLMIPVEAPVAGTVTAVHADDGAPVEFDQPLLSIRPEGR